MRTRTILDVVTQTCEYIKADGLKKTKGTILINFDKNTIELLSVNVVGNDDKTIVRNVKNTLVKITHIGSLHTLFRELRL